MQNIKALSLLFFLVCSASLADVAPPASGRQVGAINSSLLGMNTPVSGQRILTKRRFMRAHIDFVAKADRFRPMVEVSGTYMPNAELQGENGQFDLNQFKLDALIPIPLDRDTFLLVGLGAGIRNYEFDTDVVGANNTTLYHFALRIGAGRFITDRLAIRAYWQPSINSDLDGDLTRNDWKPWQGNVLAVYRSSENVFWKGGVVFTDAFDLGVVPAGGVSWIFAPDWRLDILLPRNTEISFTPNANWLFHGGVELEGLETGKYRVRTQTSAGEETSDVRVQELRAFLGAMYRFNIHLSSFIKAGATVGGDYDWDFGGNGDYDGTLELGPFVQAGLGWYF